MIKPLNQYLSATKMIDGEQNNNGTNYIRIFFNIK